MDGKSHQHGPYAYRWMAQYRVGFAENFPEITPPDHVLPENDGFVNWNAPMLWQVGGLKERYLVSNVKHFLSHCVGVIGKNTCISYA